MMKKWRGNEIALEMSNGYLLTGGAHLALGICNQEGEEGRWQG
jgi:hypothetical protein